MPTATLIHAARLKERNKPSSKNNRATNEVIRTEKEWRLVNTNPTTRGIKRAKIAP